MQGTVTLVRMELAEEIICSCGHFLTALLIGDIQSLTLRGHLVGKEAKLQKRVKCQENKRIEAVEYQGNNRRADRSNVK